MFGPGARTVVVFLAASTLVLPACSGAAPATPAPAQRPAFAMLVLRRVRCEEGSTATACFRVKVTNIGSAAGRGSCRLATTQVVNGQQTTLVGRPFLLDPVEAGASVIEVASWDTELPDPPAFTGVCGPGPLL
jgi:cellulase/cellobiase CelA1